MSTPTDPYSSNSRRPFEDDEILAPIPASSPSSAATPSSASTPSSGAQVNPPAFVDDSWTDTDIFTHTQGMDPAFDQQEHEPEPLDVEPSSPADAPTEMIDDDGEAAPVRTAREDVVTDYSAIDYSFGTEDDPAEEAPGATEAYPVASAQQPLATSVLPTSSLAEVSAEAAAPTAAAPFAGPVSVETPAPVNAWAAPATVSPGEAYPESIPVPTPEAPRGRGWTHTWVLLATLLLLPVAWYLLSDSIYSLELGAIGEHAPETGVNWLTLAELAGGLVVVALMWFIARLSSLGAMVTGTLLAVAGLVGVVAPSLVQTYVATPLSNFFGPDNSLVNNIILYLATGLSFGRILTFGVVLLMTGVVSHSARRRGEKYGSLTTRREITLGAAGK